MSRATKNAVNIELEAAAQRALSSIRSKSSVPSPDDLTVVCRGAVAKLTRRIGKRIGIESAKRYTDLARDWFVEDFLTGLPDYDSSRPFVAFMNTLLWRRYTRNVRGNDKVKRHLPSLHYHQSQIRGNEQDTSDQLAALEQREMMTMALGKLSAYDRATLQLWSSKLATAEICELLQISIPTWTSRAFKARELFVEAFREIWLERRLPHDEFPLRRKRARSSRSLDPAAA